MHPPARKGMWNLICPRSLDRTKNRRRELNRRHRPACLVLSVEFAHIDPKNSFNMASDSANLEELKKEVETLANKITELKKASPVDKDTIGAAVQQLLAAKKLYADNNDGIGVDGKPYEQPMTKAEKKAKAKAEKGPAKAVRFVCRDGD